ncbi:hypothetical protein SAMN05192533_10991 [Mesobacillus persicus]|uniref:Uncharacterized protein n=1 Tax=Mesobacillus persicus TaxID=930146 RepID=A0A1H8DZT9_9BACI|nr:hypothetical protein [Mesobacillus persicus]SEN12058.1 hypothetical protein SAMN05192533_10991 [Mesobacillus persicus]
MQMITFVLYTCSLASFLAMFQNLFAMQRPGIYPPKKLLKKRAGFFATSGAVLLLFGVVLSLF